MKFILYSLMFLVNELVEHTIELNQRSYSVEINHQRIIRENLMNYKNIYWLGDLCIGTPPQCFKIIFDTGSADLWIPSINCHSENCDKFSDRFDPSKSSTFSYLSNRDILSIEYADETHVSGLVGMDHVSINGVTITHQHLGVITSLNTPKRTAPYGSCGLGFHSNSQGSMTPIVLNLWHQRLIDEPIVSFWLNRYSTGGEILFGGVNSRFFHGEIIYANITQQRRQQWQIRLNGITAGPLNLCHGGCEALIDSGTTVIVGPSTEIELIQQMVPSYDPTSQTIDCSYRSSMPVLTFTVGDRPLTLNAFQYVFSTIDLTDNTTICYLGLMSSSFENDDPLWVLGGTFMTHYYTTFDSGKRRIGFAPSVSYSE